MAASSQTSRNVTLGGSHGQSKPPRASGSRFPSQAAGSSAAARQSLLLGTGGLQSAAVFVGVGLGHPVPQARLADTEEASFATRATGAVPWRASSTARRRNSGGCGAGMRTSFLMAEANSGQVSGKRGQASERVQMVWRPPRDDDLPCGNAGSEEVKMTQAPAAIFKIPTESPQPDRGRGTGSRCGATWPRRAARDPPYAPPRDLRCLPTAARRSGESAVRRIGRARSGVGARKKLKHFPAPGHRRSTIEILIPERVRGDSRTEHVHAKAQSERGSATAAFAASRAGYTARTRACRRRAPRDRRAGSRSPPSARPWVAGGLIAASTVTGSLTAGCSWLAPGPCPAGAVVDFLGRLVVGAVSAAWPGDAGGSRSSSVAHLGPHGKQRGVVKPREVVAEVIHGPFLFPSAVGRPAVVSRRRFPG